MAVDLSDLVESVRRETSPPGSDVFPNSSDDDWLGQLRDSFWEAKLYGFFGDYTESDGIVFPIGGSQDLGRDMQQLIVLFAGIRSIRMQLANQNSVFRAKAGAVEFETQSSANVMNTVLKQLQDKVTLLQDTLGNLVASQTYYINGISARSDSFGGGESWWG